MMSADCMQSGMKIMSDKGMDMKGIGMMGNDNMKSNEDDHQVHH